MSQDLFAAFGTSEPAITPNLTTPQSAGYSGSSGGQLSWIDNKATDPIQQNLAVKDASLGDDDDFGDFEDASPSVVPGSSVKPNVSVDETKLSPRRKSNKLVKPFPPKAPPTQAEDIISSKSTEMTPNVGHHPFAGRMDLLFETGDDEYDAGADELGDISSNPEAAMAYSKKIIAEQEAAQAKAKEPRSSRSSISKVINKSPGARASPPRNRLKKKSGYIPTEEPEVLFDVENVSEGDDDFGDFESKGHSRDSNAVGPVAIQVNSGSPMPAIDLLGLDEPIAPSYSNTTNGYSNDNREYIIKTNHTPTTQPAPSTTEDDDEWDDFETAPPAEQPISTSSILTPPAVSHSCSTSTKTTSTPGTRLPPTNIPPPALLLSIFPTLFAEADDALFNALSKLDLKQRQILLAHPTSHQFLKGYLNHISVLARIVAGRKQRWKRDQHLSQSMRIGPAAAGGKGGMKLTGVDKSESAKENREIVDVLRLWKNQSSKVRTAVTAASAAPAAAKLPAVPEIVDQMPVRALTQAEGGITAPHACALCGLKREERVAKVDGEADDIFGEWWVQGMNMHVACRDFWDDFEKKLKSR